MELHACQHHVFMDWRFVDNERWREMHAALNGAGAQSMQGQWDEMFGVKEEIAKEVKVKKPRKKAAGKVENGKRVAGKKPMVKQTPAKKKPAAKKTSGEKSSSG